MKTIKCDRCGKTDGGQHALSYGISTMYIPSLSVYHTPDAPIRDVDLCQKCYGELYRMVNKFMREVKDEYINISTALEAVAEEIENNHEIYT